LTVPLTVAPFAGEPNGTVTTGFWTFHSHGALVSLPAPSRTTTVIR
jgi:hypothetical protein